MSTVVISNPQPGVTQLTLNRPEKLNAMNVELISELHDALAAVAADDSCRAVVLTGAGRGFCSGLDLGVSWLLPRLIGASRAWELMLTGRIIESAEADAIGLVARVVPDDQLLDAALETASLIAANSPWGVRMTKEVAWSQLEIGSLQAGIDLENRTQILSSFTADSREAMTAFLERRPANFEGR